MTRKPSAMATAAEAFGNTSTGERIIYTVLLALGFALIVIGVNADRRSRCRSTQPHERGTRHVRGSGHDCTANTHQERVG